MAYVKATNGQIDQYPYTVGQLRRDTPNVSFPRQIPSGTLAEFGVFPVTVPDDPAYNADTQRILTSGQPSLVAGAWMLVKTVVPLTDEELAAVKDRKKLEIKRRRDVAINAGTTFSGMTVATDDLSQQRITGAALAATVDPSVVVKWKLPNDSFVELTAAQIIDIAQAVRTHVQACFNREAELLAALNAGQSYDIDAGWPT